MPAPQRDSGIIAGINITPLVDIVLVLLIIFIVTAKIIVAPAVPVNLPAASQGEEMQVVFSVILPAAGPRLVNGEAIANDDVLLARATEALKRDTDVRAVINADGVVPHAQVLRVLDVLKTAGMSRVAFGVQPLAAAEPKGAAR